MPSVGEHLILVERIAGTLKLVPCTGGGLAALPRESHEHAFGDMISPPNDAADRDRRALEERLQGEILVRFGLLAEVADAARYVIDSADGAAGHLQGIRPDHYFPHEKWTHR